MKAAFISSEVVPYAKTGGLADVSGSLPIALSELGVDVKVFMPKYYSVNEFKYNLRFDDYIGEMKIRTGGHPHSAWVYSGKLPNSQVDIYAVHNPHFFHRHKIYTNDWDEDERFIFFQKAVIETIQRLNWAPDVLNINDWQTSLIPLLIKDNYSWDKLFSRSASLLTIHNVGYQGVFAKNAAIKAEIKEELFSPGGPVEHNGAVNFLKTGILYSEIINTVSETYSKELLSPEYGAGMESVLSLRKDDLYGIVNGVDYTVWNPETDKHIPYHYSINDLSGKEKNKKFLMEHMHLHYEENVPLIGIVSRLVRQKGFDIIAEALPHLINSNCKWVVLGSGETVYEELFEQYARAYPNKFSVYLGYNNELAHLIEAGADIFLMPSRYEPCGLNQIYSLKYGTVPVVRKTGGLADTVHDWNELNSYGKDIGNGFSFSDYSALALAHSVNRALNDYHNKPVWKKIQTNGMAKDYSWKTSAKKYLDLYNKAVTKRN